MTIILPPVLTAREASEYMQQVLGLVARDMLVLTAGAMELRATLSALVDAEREAKRARRNWRIAWSAWFAVLAMAVAAVVFRGAA